MMKRTQLEKYRQLQDLRIDELVATATELLRLLNLRQRRYKVAEYPDARTVRYYISRGLVDKPLGKSGPAARYGYRHLLQLLVVKCLQTQYLPIRKIAEMVKELDNAGLEQLLEEASGKPLEDQELVAGGAVVGACIGDIPVGLGMGLLLGILGRKRSLQAPSAILAQGDPQVIEGEEHVSPLAKPSTSKQREREKEKAVAWDRYELVPGLELHARRGFRLPGGSSLLNVLLSQLKNILRRYQE